MYQLLATDLDGTLFDSRGMVSEQNRQAIREAARRGISVILCSGRAPYERLEELGKELGLNCPGNYYICCSGAMIVDAVTLRVVAGNYLSVPAAQKLLDTGEYFFRDMGKASIRIHTTNSIYVRNPEIWENSFEARTGRIMEPLPSDLGKLDGEITKMLFLSPVEGYAMRFYDRMQEVLPEGALGYRMPPALAEYVSADANKGNAVRQLAALLGMELGDVICVGDGWNDISMLSGSGLGIAVKNAPEEVACQADVRFPYTNDEDAVARILEQYFLI